MILPVTTLGQMTTWAPVWVPAFSLLWLIVGILIGRRLPRLKPMAKAKPAAKPRRARETGRDNGSQGGGSGTGSELYVGNLPYSVTDSDVEKAFGKFGKVVSVRLIENKQSGKPKGFGFVEMAAEKQADAAIAGLNGAKFEGRALVVNSAKSRGRRG